MAIDLNQFGRPLEDAAVKRDRIREALQGRIHSFVSYLYPRAVKRHDARLGSVLGEPGSSLAICLDGDATGRWIDHATGERGDVFGLWAAAHNMDPVRDFARVLSECESWLGGNPSPQAQARHNTELAKPPAPEEIGREVATYPYLSAAGDRLFDVVRIEKYSVDGEPILKDGKIAKEYKPRQPDGRWGYPPGLRPLYRLPDIDSAAEVVLVEGEKAADALHLAGWTATSAPGGSNTRLDKIDWRPLAGKSVTLWPDNDEAGKAFMDRVATVLRDIGCKVATVALPDGLPAKWDAADANLATIKALLDEPAQIARGYRFLSISDLAARKPPEWIIDQILPEEAFSVLYGASGSYKTFIAIDMALSVACGLEWRQKVTRSCGVAYIAGEGVGGLYKRIMAWMSTRSEGQSPDFQVLDHSVPITDPESLQALISGIEAMPFKPGLIILDTLARNFGFGDENSTKDMNMFVASVDALRKATGAHVMAVHHTGKDGAKGARGSSVLRAAVDTEIEIEREGKTRIVTFRITKQKDVEEVEDTVFEMVNAEASDPRTGEVLASVVPVLTQRNVPSAEATNVADWIETYLLTGDKTAEELSERIGVHRTTVARTCHDMEKNGQISSYRHGKKVLYHLCTDRAQEKDQ